MDPISAFLINLIITVVLGTASSLLSQAFSKSPTRDSRTGTRGSAQLGGKVPQYFLVGTVGEPGKREYRNAWGTAGGVPNAYLTDVHSFGDLPISGMVGLFVNGVRVSIPTEDAVAQGYPVAEYPDNLWWKFFTGDQTTADSYLVDKFGDDADRAWLEDMVGVGVPYLVTTALWSETLWTSFPSFVGEFEGIPLYDPRQDDTAGGEGDQRWDDQSTWAFSDNNAVIIYNIERGIHYDGVRVWGGSSTEAQMPYEVWAAAMDRCDAGIDLVGGGAERQFRAGRRINLNERPADVIKELLIGANARYCPAADGIKYILVGVPDAADGAFTDADVLATEPLGSIPFPNLDDIINGATATYREPEQAWEDKETAPYLRADLEAEDDGRQQLEGLDLGTTFSGTQAQRILKAVIEEGRRFRRHVVALPPEFAQYRPLQVLAWTSPRFDYVAKLFLITVRTRDPWGKVVFGLQEIDPADHDWDPETDEQPLSFAPVVTNRPPPQEVSGFHVEPAIALDTEGNARRPAVDVFWSSTSVAVDVEFVRISHRLDGETAPRWQGLIPRPQLLEGSARVLEALLPGDDFEFQIEYLAGSGRATVASGWLPVTTPDVKLGFADVEIDLDDVAAELMPILAPLQQGMRALIESYKTLGTLLEETDRENFSKRESLRRSIEVQLGDVVAGFEEIIETAVGPGGAIGMALSSLYAAMGGNTSEVNVAWEVRAAPSGYAARYAITAAVDDGVFRAGTFLIDVPSNPLLPVRIVLDADQVVISSDGGATVAALFQAGTTYLDVARIQNASITGAHIASATIDGANIKSATIDGANIKTLAVETIHIQDAAVTALDTVDLGPGSISNGAGSYVTLASFNMLTAGYPGTVAATYSFQTTAPSYASPVDVQLLVNGVTVESDTHPVLGGAVISGTFSHDFYFPTPATIPVVLRYRLTNFGSLPGPVINRNSVTLRGIYPKK